MIFLGLLRKYYAIAALLIIFLMLGYQQYLKTRLKAAVVATEQLKTDFAVKTQIREKENEFKIILANKVIEKEREVHEKIIYKIKVDYETYTHRTNITIASLRSELRKQISRQPLALPEIASNTKVTTEDWRDRYTTAAGQYATLVKGCQITTADYNNLRSYTDNNCLIFGCQP